MWLYLSASRNHEDALAAVRPYQARDKTAWPHPMLQYFTGKATLDQAMAAAKDGKNELSNLCEFYFYAGEKALTDGQDNQAREYFKKSVDTGVVEYYEHWLAGRRLKLLDGK